MNKVGIGLFGKVFDLCSLLGTQFRELLQVALGEHNHERLGLEQGFDRLEQRNLLIDSVATCLGDIEQEEDGCIEMSKGRDCLHFNRIALVKGMVQHTWGVNHLPTRVLVISVTHEQVLSCEGVGLNINISIRNVVDEA